MKLPQPSTKNHNDWLAYRDKYSNTHRGIFPSEKINSELVCCIIQINGLNFQHFKNNPKEMLPCNNKKILL